MDEKNKNRDAESFKDKLLNYGNQKSMEQYEEELRLERRRRAMENRKKKLAELTAADLPQAADGKSVPSSNGNTPQDPSGGTEKRGYRSWGEFVRMQTGKVREKKK